MSVKALQDYTFTSKYARYLPELQRRETWNEAIDRVRDMHIRRYPEIKEEITWAFEQSRQKRVLGSQRALQFGGSAIEKKHSRIFNCIASYCDRQRFFQEALWLLLSGCGVGFSVQKHHIAKLPAFSKKCIGRLDIPESRTHVIVDSIEGWADSVGVLLSSFFGGGDFPEYEGFEVLFDYSQIRPEGAALGSSSGKAPGPKPLQRALDKAKDLIVSRIASGNERLKSIDAYDIVMHLSDAVLSGGVRRSATICLFSPDDEEMATAKIGNWFIDNPQRGRSNNSALLLRDKTTKEEFEKLMGYVREFGEPGFVWSDSTELVVNPCVTADTIVAVEDGLKSVENLIGEQFSALVDGKSYNSSSKGFWKTGVQDVIELEFSSGRRLRLTQKHELLTENGWKEAGEISFEENVIINNHRNFLNDSFELNEKDYAKGYCLGHLLGDGNVVDNTSEMKWWGDKKDFYRNDALNLLKCAEWNSVHHKELQENKSLYSCLQSVELRKFAESKNCLNESKHLDKKAIEGNRSYLAGLVAGYFDADGTVSVNHKKGCSVRITSANLENLENIQIILNYFGVFSKIYNDRYPEGDRLMPNGKKELELYHCNATHELCIACDSIHQFSKLIPIRNEDKINKINEIIDGYKRNPNRTSFVDKIVNKRLIGRLPVYDCTIDDVHAFDANGVYAHNCVEIGLYPVDVETGESGWEACNLCEINGKKCKTPEDFEIACRAAAIIGTCQAGYSDLQYLGPVSKRIIEKEALLGVSITGMMDNPDILFDPALQRKMAHLIIEINEDIAKKIGINPSARISAIKPAGTTSCILGTASGIHPHHAMRYIRRSQGNYLEAPLQHFKKTNPLAVERSVWNANGTDEVVAFCIEVPKGAKTKNDIDAKTLLEYVKLTQENWVLSGTRLERCTQPWLTHNVSNTITVHPEEWDLVTDFIYENRKCFCGISLLPISGDKDYPQAPFTAVHTPQEITKMYGDGSLMASGLIVDGLAAFDNNLWKACDAVLGRGELIAEPVFDIEAVTPIEQSKMIAAWQAKTDWIRRAKQFAERYFEDDVREMTFCLKDVSNWKYWCDLNREYKEVDYSQMVEEQDGTKQAAEWACSGGSCDIHYV